jgi:hypothetical protein
MVSDDHLAFQRSQHFLTVLNITGRVWVSSNTGRPPSERVLDNQLRLPGQVEVRLAVQRCASINPEGGLSHFLLASEMSSDKLMRQQLNALVGNLTRIGLEVSLP